MRHVDSTAMPARAALLATMLQLSSTVELDTAFMQMTLRDQGGNNLGYNGDPNYKQSLASTGPCDVTDGSAFSSSYPCDCGSALCLDGEACESGNTTCTAAGSLSLVWPQGCVGIGSTTFRRTGESASGAPVYSNGEGTYIYYDPHCNGNDATSVGQWIIDDDAPNLNARSDLDGDGACADWAHVASDVLSGPKVGAAPWQVTCDGAQFRAHSLAVSLHANLATPPPTLGPGKPCLCEGCGSFPVFDLDGNGCLVEAEVDAVTELRGLFSGLDANSDGCVNQTECSTYEEQHSLELPKYKISNPEECDYGMYVPDGASACLPCVGGSTSRRRSHTCTPCGGTDFDAGEYDNCIGGTYITADADAGACTLQVNSLSGLAIGDTITIASRNPGHFEEVTITGFRPIQLDHCLTQAFTVYDSVTPACTKIDGAGWSASYPCGCGKETCGSGQICDRGESTGSIAKVNGTIAGTSGRCMTAVQPGDRLPTPIPTVSAQGDPHLINLQGEHFDVNQVGEFLLLRIPQDPRLPADFSLRSTIQAEFGHPCATYITQVELTGAWFDHKALEVRSYRKSHSNETQDKFLGARVISTVGQETPWQNISDWSNTALVLSSKGDYTVKVSKTHWSNRRHPYPGAPNVAGQFEIHIQNKKNPEATRVIIRQDITWQQHLNVAVRRLSAVGRVDVGGLLGFDEHPESLEDVTPECQRHRDGEDGKNDKNGKKGPRPPAWKTRWTRIKEERSHAHDSDDNTNDNEAAASLTGDTQSDLRDDRDSDDDRDLMCVCPSAQSIEDLSTEDLAADEEAYLRREGIITDFQTARLAEASWD